MPQGLEEAGGQRPEEGWLSRRLTARQSRGDDAQFSRRVDVGVAHEFEHALIQPRTHFGTVGQRLRRGAHGRIGPAPGHRPQVGRVDAVRSGQLLHLPILREQAQCRARPLAQLGLQVFDQRKAGLLQRLRRRLGALVGALHELLDGTFHPAHRLRSGRLVDHLQRTGHLMKLLASHAQRTGIDRPQIDASRALGLACEALERLADRLDRLAGLVQHPGQRPQVSDDGSALRARLDCGAHHHDFIHSRSGFVPARADSSSTTRSRPSRQAILNRATDWRSSSAMRASSRTWVAVVRVPSPVCSVTAKMCWMLPATSLA